MRLSRKVVAEFVGVFLAGTAVGALFMWDFTDTKLSQFMTKTNDPEATIVTRVTQKYIKDYQLSPDEMARIEPLIKEMAHRITAIRHRFGVDMMGTIDNYHQQIAAQLNPEHRDAYLKANAERRKQISSMLLLDPDTPAPGRD